jgi:DNA-binding response OmpR family regulator
VKPLQTASAKAVRGYVLVADADADSRELYKHCLADRGYAVDEAFDGREALVKAYTVRPQLVIADVQIPFINGVELCRLLRSDPAMNGLRLMLITADSRVGAQDLTRSDGVDAVLVKPFKPDALVERVTALVAAAPAHGGAPAPGSAAVPAAPSPLAPHAMSISDVVGKPLKAQRREQFVTRQPALTPPPLRCPICDRVLQYDRSHVGGVGTHTTEQWDYFLCPQCGTFQYRHRTRKLRRVP